MKTALATHVGAVAAPILRQAYKREVLPARVRWWMAAAGLRDWFRFVAKELEPHLGEDARTAMAELVAEMWSRRYDDVCTRWTWLDSSADRRAIASWAAGLYRINPRSRGLWLWDGVGGPPLGAAQWWHAHRSIAPASTEDRWQEITVHLGEWLIVLTECLPAKLPRANAVLGDICFRAGVRYAEAVANVMGIAHAGHRVDRIGGRATLPPNPLVKNAIEILRMSEYLFRVNPTHESATEGQGGYIAGSSCPWHPRPGWQRMHCGIFGQFQSGIASVFGLSYHLTKTIPKHGGDVCRIDLKPIPIRLAR